MYALLLAIIALPVAIALQMFWEMWRDGLDWTGEPRLPHRLGSRGKADG